MKFTDLVGKHKLSGVDYGIRKVFHSCKNDEDAQCIIFKLDGVEYLAQEDPDDGWRSYCCGIMVVKNEIKNIFDPIDVMCKISKQYEDNDVLQIIDMKTNKTVLLIGTDYSEDWYPCCIMHYRPENLCLNNKKGKI